MYLRPTTIVHMKYGFINKKGEIVVPFVYDYLYGFHEGLAMAYQKKKYGFIDQAGNIVIPFDYEDAISHFDNGFAIVMQNGLCGIIDVNGAWVVPSVYESISRSSISSSLDRLIVKLNGKWGMVNKNRDELIPFRYDALGYDPDNEVAMFQRDKEMGLVTIFGEEISLDKYDEVCPFSEGRILVKKNNLAGFVDMNGDEIVPCIYPLARDYSEDMAVVATRGKYGYLDKSGNLAIPQIYTNGWDFSEGLGRVKSRSNKWGFIDKTGATAISFEYGQVSAFENGVAIVERKSLNGVIDKQGNEIIPCELEYGISSFHEGIAIIEQVDYENFKLTGPKGYMNLEGKVIAACKYDDAVAFKDGMGMVKEDGLWGCVDRSGELVVPCQYGDYGLFGEDGLAAMGIR